MDWLSIILGILATGYGIYTLINRSKPSYNSHRMNSLKNLFGENAGDKVHLFAYTVIPIVIGIMMFSKVFGY